MPWSKDQRRQYKKDWRAKHPSYYREWMDKHPGYRQEYYSRPGVKERATATARERNYTYRYGITLQQYEEILQTQGERCASCKRTLEEVGQKNRFHVDHDHVTGHVRGILCHYCNDHMSWFDAHHEIVVRYKAHGDLLQ